MVSYMQGIVQNFTNVGVLILIVVDNGLVRDNNSFCNY